MSGQEKEPPDTITEENNEEYYDAEILDEMTTHRGELKLRTVSFNEERHFQVRETNPQLQTPFFLNL